MALGGGNSGGSASGIKAGSAYVTLGLKNFLPQDLLKAQQSFGKFGDAIGKMGRAMALGGAAALTPLVGAMSTLNDVAKQGSIANALGLTSEQFTGMAGAAKAVGNNTREFIESLVTLGKLGTDAVGNIGTVAAPAFKTLGLNAEEFIKLRTDEQFFQMFAAIKKVEDPLARVRMLMLAFGEDGGKLLLPLLDKSNEELRKFAAGFAVSSDDMVKAQQAALSYTAATSALGKAWRSVSIAAAPIVKAIADGFAQAAGPLSGFINSNREIVVGLGLAAGGITAVGVGLMVLGPAIKALTASWGLFTGAVVAGKAVIAGTFAVLASPILVLPAALAGAGAAWLAFTTDGNSAVGKFVSSITSAFGDITKAWKITVAAVNSGDLSGAFNVATSSLRVEGLKIANFFEELWAREKMRANRARAVLDAINASVDYDAADRAAAAAAKAESAANYIPIQGPPTLLAMGAMGVDTSRVAMAGGRASLLSEASKKALEDAKNQATAAQLGVYLTAQWKSLTGGIGGGLSEMGRLFGGGNPIAAQIKDIASRSLGGFGGSANVGQFGQGGDVGKQIAANTKATADGVKALLSVRRYNESTGIMVEGGG